MENNIKFPEDFLCTPHRVIPGATQWVYPADKEQDAVISIVGGGFGLYGDGVTTFEMYDFREDDVQSWLSIDAINLHLKDNPVIPEDTYDNPPRYEE